MINPIETATEQFQYLEDFAMASGSGLDPHASVINAYIFGSKGPSAIANQFTYTKPEPFPSILGNFTGIQPQISSTLRVTNLTDLTIELGQPEPVRFFVFEKLTSPQAQEHPTASGIHTQPHH